MIERVVLVKLSDAYANEDGRYKVVQHARRVLPLIPGVSSVSVGPPADPRSLESWDVSMILRFERIEDVERYRVDPDHRAFVDEFLTPRMAVIKAWNFDVGA